MEAETKIDNSNTQFMLQEYERLSTLRTEEISQSARRVDFFLTITAAVAGGLFVTFQISTIPQEVIIAGALGALSILLLFGLHTLNRLNARNVQLLFIDRSIAMVQNYFGRRDPDVAENLRRLEEERKKPQYHGIQNFILKRLRGTLTDLIVLSNGLISGGIAVAAIYSKGHSVQTMAPSEGFLVKMLVKIAFTFKIREKSEQLR